jgi:hypothetical protein
MEKCNFKNVSLKKASFYNKNVQGIRLSNLEAEIRLGISLADEKAQAELRKRKLEAPLSIEEKILKNK